jgi:hypothetical protein
MSRRRIKIKRKGKAVQIRLDTILKDLNGESFKTPETESVEATDSEGEPVLDENGNPVFVSRPKSMTLRDTLALVLSANSEPGKTDWKELLNRGVLARRIMDAQEEIELKAEDVSSIKRILAKSIYNPVIILRIMEQLDPGELPEDLRPSASKDD